MNKPKYQKGITERPCTKCGVIKPVSDFSPRRNRPSGIMSVCRECNSKNRGKYNRDHKKWYANAKLKDPEHFRGRNLKRNYGITVDEFELMLKNQGGVCMVCRGPAMGKGRYHVDHDHNTKKIRGLLCHKCNVALGMVQDNVEHLTALITYLNLNKSELS